MTSDTLFTTNTRALTLGNPIFKDAELRQLASEQGDAQAWLQAVNQHGAEAALGVTGEFAIALETPSGACFLATDRFATHSLCYTVKDDKLQFAARADELSQGSPELDLQAVYDYLYFHVIPSPRTIYKGVFRLPPGHYAWFENGVLSVHAYWRPEFQADPAADFETLRREFRQHLQAAVRTQVDPAKPAAFLSGGTDSSTITGMVREATGQAPSTYSIGFEAEGYDEMAFARITARHYQTEHHEYYVTPDDLLRGMPEVATYYDQPFGNSSAVPAFYCAKMAREDGVSKMLAGDGGDELFGGNTRYAKQRVFGVYNGIPAGLRQSVLEPLAGSRAMQSVPLIRKAASYVNQAKVTMPGRLQSYNLLERLGIDQVLTREFLTQVDLAAPAGQQTEVWAQTSKANLVDQMLAFDWRYTLAECDLPKVRGSAALAGVEVGFPMLDAGLVDFSMRLPASYKVRGLKLRWFFKEALRGFLPDEVITKKKQGFGLPYGVWTHRHAGLQALATDLIDGLVARGLVMPAFGATLVSQRLAEHPGYFGEMVWILSMLELWLRKHAPDWRL